MRRDNPYLFLKAYTAENAHLFRGREQELSRLAGLLDSNRHILLFGPVGAGKTSLIQAALTPCLAAQGVQVYTLWAGQDQVWEVHSPAGPGQPSPLAWPDWLGRRIQPDQAAVVVFDQLESFFRGVPRPTVEAWGADLAQAWADRPALRAVWTIREGDLFYMHLLADAFPEILAVRLYLDHLQPEQARQAIVGPTKGSGIVYTDALLAALLHDLGPQRIPAPALQIVCWTLCRNLDADQTTLDLPDYRQLGGAKAILTGYLDGLLAELPDEEEQDLARAMLKEMVEPADLSLAWEMRTAYPADLDRLSGGNVPRSKSLLRFWQERGIVRPMPQGHSLAHPFLIHRVSEWAQEDNWATKDVRDLIQRDLLAYWRTGKLVDKQGLGRLRQSYARMRLSADEIALIVRSAMAQGYQWSFWAEYATRAGVLIWPIVREMLQSAEPRSRSSAVAALGELRGAEAIELLSQALNDPYPNVRGLARAALAARGTSEATAVLHNNPPLNMVLIPAGTFWMGSEANPDERPMRQVHLDAFYIDRYPVTQAEYAKFIQDTGYPPPPHWEPYGGTFPPGKDNHPVAYVCWFDARDYAEWAGKRLPTEAEWEKAARGADGRQYPWGEQFNSLYCNTDESEYGDTTPVDAFSPDGDSPYGVSDLSGNVWEWVADWYDRNYYQWAPDHNPPGPEKGKTKVVRGGAWEFSAHESRCSMRNHEYPGPRHGLIGFRCADTPKPGEI